MSKTFLLDLTEIQPSQLYISRAKLAAVRDAWRPPRLATLPPIPVKLLNGRVIYTDGHTRAFAAYRHGFRQVPVYWDADDLDWEAYQICVDWCLAVGIRTVMDLEGRLLPQQAYEVLWIERCSRMHGTLAASRASSERTLSGPPAPRPQVT
ncbi:MAG: hypothetical protein ACP5JG_03690 [Anaerolineae bacterium]